MSQDQEPSARVPPGAAEELVAAGPELVAAGAEPVAMIPDAPSPLGPSRLGPRGLAMLVGATVLLVALSVCVAAFILQMTGTFHVDDSANLRDFVNRNQLAPRVRAQVLLRLGVAAAIGCGLVVALYAHGRRSRTKGARAARVLRTARLLSPLLLPALARPLLLANEWDALSRIGGVAVIALLAERCFRVAATEVAAGRIALARLLLRAGRRVSAFSAKPRAVAPETIAMFLGVAFYAVWMSYGTILQHRQFATTAYDLGNYDNMFFNLMHGRPFRTWSVLPTGGNWSMLSNHAEFTMFVLVPFYALKPGSETLLIMQAVALALGAIPLYRLAARRLPRPAALALALAYLLYAPMHQANYYDIHFQPFAVPCTLWALWALDAERPIFFGISFALAIGCREDVPIGFVFFGFYLLFTGKRTRMAIVMTIVAVVYFVVVKMIVMPHFGTWWFNEFYKELYPAGESTYGGIVKTLLSNPAYVFKTFVIYDKLVYLLLVLTPLAFLPLRRGLLWMSLLPGIPFTLLTTAYMPTVSVSFQYVLIYVPFVFAATAMALGALRDPARGSPRLWGALGSIALATFLTTHVWGAMPPGDKFKGGFRDIAFRPVTDAEKQKARDIAELAAKIPKTASISVSETEHPHVSNRLDIMTLRQSHENVDYILYAEDSGSFGADAARGAIDSGEYEVVERRPASRMTLLRRKAPKR